MPNPISNCFGKDGIDGYKKYISAFDECLFENLIAFKKYLFMNPAKAIQQGGRKGFEKKSQL